MSFLTTSPLWIAGVLLLGGMTLLAMLGPIVMRRVIGLERLRTNNEVAGFKFATIGVLYAVLLAFAVIVVWEKYSEAENTVALEAGAAATVYRLSEGLGQARGADLRDAMTAYLDAAIGGDWPAMARGVEDKGANEALNTVYATLTRHEPADALASAVMQEILGQLDTITQSRRGRIVMATGIVPGVVWLVLFGGAFVTIGFTFFFGTENLRAQALMTGALALLISAGLLIIVAIDHPFAGTVKVTPEALAIVRADFGGATPGG